MRGGLEKLTRSEGLTPLLLCFWLYVIYYLCHQLPKKLTCTMNSISVISNTTCPASDLVAAGWHLTKSNLVLEQYGSNVGIFQLCPPELFTAMIELSDLRLRATQQQEPLSFTGAESNLADQGYDILNRIHNVSMIHWAQSKPSGPSPSPHYRKIGSW